MTPRLCRGRVRKDESRNLDWENTPSHPYHPSRSDYRQPGPEPFGLLEIPMSMIYSKTNYDKHPLFRYADLSFRNEVVKDGLLARLQSAEELVTITHPSAILPDYGYEHGLLSFDIQILRKNVETIVNGLNEIGRPFRFLTLKEYGEIASVLLRAPTAIPF
jgi:hypothetical protein